MSLSVQRGGTLLTVSTRKTIPIIHKFCVQKLLMVTFPSYFFIFITDFQFTIIISYALLTNNSLISFDHPLCNLKHITSDYLSAKRFKMFSFLLYNWSIKQPSYPRYFYLLVFPCFHSFHGLHFPLKLTSLLTSSVHHLVSLCLAVPFVH